MLSSGALCSAYDGNLVGLPKVVIPTGFVPVEGTEGPRQDYQDGRVRLQAVRCCHCVHCLRLDVQYKVSSYGNNGSMQFSWIVVRISTAA